MFDTAIVGTGPAGLSAALNLVLHGKSIIWFGSKDLSRKVELSERIANYPGMITSGSKLNESFRQQIEQAGLEVNDCMVTNITSTRSGFMVLGGNEIFDARTVLLAVGAVNARGFEGEKKLLGKGVSYCAACDGYLYKGKRIAVFCGDAKFEHEAEYLAETADKVYLFTPYKGCGVNMPNVELLTKPIKEIIGGERAEGIRFADGSELEVDGVFIIRNAVAPAVLVKGLSTEDAHIVVDRNMRTNKIGVFAAGDCTGRPYQIAKAVGEGNIAAHAILEYLAELN